jgi:hypothetical protein
MSVHRMYEKTYSLLFFLTNLRRKTKEYLLMKTNKQHINNRRRRKKIISCIEDNIEINNERQLVKKQCTACEYMKH